MEPLIIQYTNLLHRCGSPQGAEAMAFVKKHHADKTFVKRAEMVNRLFALRDPVRARSRTAAAAQAPASRP